MRGFEDIDSKGHFQPKRVFFWVKNPPKGVTIFLGHNNIKNEFSTIKLFRAHIFSKIRQLLKNHYHFNIFGGKNAPQGGN